MVARERVPHLVERGSEEAQQEHEDGQDCPQGRPVDRSDGPGAGHGGM
jgi:hypothetical protein